MTPKKMRELIENYPLADREIKKIEKYKDSLKEQIIALGEGAHRGVSGQVTVSTSESLRLNNDLLKAKFGDALADCYKSSQSVTVRVALFDKE